MHRIINIIYLTGLPKTNKGTTSSKEVAVVGYIIYLTMGQLLPPMFGESIR